MNEDEPAVPDRIAHDLSRLVRIVTHLRQRGDIAVAHVLAHLAEHGPQRLSAIAHAVGADPSTVSRKVAALVEEGLVERRPDPDDGRAHLLAVTEQGVRCGEHGHAKRIELMSAVLSGWSDESRHRLAELLGRLADDAQERDRWVAPRSGGES